MTDAPVLHAGAGTFSAVLIGHDHMWPTIRMGAVVFLAEPKFSGPGIYSLPECPKALRRVSVTVTGYTLRYGQLAGQ